MLMPMGFYAIKVTQWHNKLDPGRRPNLSLNSQGSLLGLLGRFLSDQASILSTRTNNYEKDFFVSHCCLRRDYELMCGSRYRYESASWTGEENVSASWASKKTNR